MFHTVANVVPLENYKLNIFFSNGVSKIYDLSLLFNTIPAFLTLKNNPNLFSAVKVDIGGYGIVWNETLDLSCEELWENGICK